MAKTFKKKDGKLEVTDVTESLSLADIEAGLALALSEQTLAVNHHQARVDKWQELHDQAVNLEVE